MILKIKAPCLHHVYQRMWKKMVKGPSPISVIVSKGLSVIIVSGCSLSSFCLSPNRRRPSRSGHRKDALVILVAVAQGDLAIPQAQAWGIQREPPTPLMEPQ